MSAQHNEFPELTPEARGAFERGYEANGLFVPTPDKSDRVRFAAFLREAMKEAINAQRTGKEPCLWEMLHAIANSLHNPPPPPPTLAQARAADLSTPEGQATVRSFLASLAAETQP